MIDIAVDRPSAPAPQAATRATPPAEWDDAEEGDEAEAWHDDVRTPEVRAVRLRGTVVGPLDAASLGRLDARLKRRFLDRAVRRLT